VDRTHGAASVRRWDAGRVARAAAAELGEGRPGTGSEPGPRRATIDSRGAGPGDLFVGLRGERSHGGEYALQALRAGAWGVLVTPEHARAALDSRTAGTVLVHPDPLAGLQALARAWVRELRARGTRIVGVTGSTGKTSTKDILAALLQERPTVASPENFNTEIGLPLTVLAAPIDTDVLVLEMAMRGAGQIAELTAIAEPDVGVIVNVGPVHIELLGTLEAIAAAKAELIAGLRPGATAVVPAGEQLLAPHLREDVRTVTFGDGGNLELEAGRSPGEVVIREGSLRIALEPSFRQAHQLENLLAAVAAARALGVTPQGPVEVSFSSLRGERLGLGGGVVLINDCYNANPMSMRAAIDDLVESAPGRRVAVLGDMLELGSHAARFHREIGRYAAARGVDLLVTVGPLAAMMRETYEGEAYSVPDPAAAVELLRELLAEGDTVLVKGSRGVGLERVAEGLGGGRDPARADAAGASALARDAGPGRS